VWGCEAQCKVKVKTLEATRAIYAQWFADLQGFFADL
jgi:hypothetical protein